MLSFFAATINIAVLWFNTTVTVPLNEPFEPYKYVPEVQLEMNGSYIEDPEMFMEYEVNHTTFRVIRTSVIGEYRVVYRAHFPSYHITSDQAIIFKVAESIPPTIEVDDIEINVGAKLPDLKEYINYYDNYTIKEKLKLYIDSTAVNVNAVGSYPVKYRVVDESNNETEVVKNLLVVDRTAPVIKELKAIQVEIGKRIDFRTFYQITDNYDQVLDVDFDDSYINYDEPGLYNLVITANDQSGNTSRKQSKVLVIDNTKPELKLKTSEITIGYNESLSITELKKYIDSVSDNYSILTIDDVRITTNLDTSKLGKYEVIYEVTDEATLVTTEKLIVNVVDNLSPELKVIKPLEVILGTLEPYLLDYIEISDNHDRSQDITLSSTGKVDTSKVGEYRVIVTLKDKSKNESLYPLVFRVKDITAPNITQLEDIVVNNFLKPNYKDFFKVTDNFDKEIEVTYEDENIDYEKIGTYELIVSAIDNSGNNSRFRTTIHVVDDEAPTIVLTSKEVFVSYDDEIDLYSYIESINDNYQENLSFEDVKIDSNLIKGVVGRYVIDYTLMDLSKNITTERLIIVLNDYIAPIINVKHIELKKNDVFDYTIYATATDNYDGDITDQIRFNPNYIPTNIPGTYEAIYYVHDSSGNYTEQRILVFVLDEVETTNYVIYVTVGVVISAIFVTYYLFSKRKVKF